MKGQEGRIKGRDTQFWGANFWDWDPPYPTPPETRLPLTKNRSRSNPLTGLFSILSCHYIDWVYPFDMG